MKAGYYLIICLIFLSVLYVPIVASDGGIIGPPQINIEENSQNAIVAWNGIEEIMILSVDISGSASTKVLRVIPLPSNPIEVKEGSFDSFTKLEEIINDKLKKSWFKITFAGNGTQDDSYSGVIEITFQESIGAHNITIVKILNVTNFSSWATNYANTRGLNNLTFSMSFQKMIEEYMDNNISYFVFDIININEDEHSINPIIYRFKSNFLFYPLKITAASDVGETNAEVNVFCITKNRIKDEVFTNISFITTYRKFLNLYGINEIDLTEEELKEISPDIFDMFKGDPLLMSYSYYGKYTKIGGDIIASQNDFSKPGIEISIPNEIFVERGTKHLVNLSVKNIGNTQLNLWLKLEGGLDWIKHSWYTVQPFSSLVYNLDVNNETTYEIMFDIPNNIPLGEYPIVYICESSNYNLSEQKQGTLILYEKYDSELGVTQIIVSNETEIVFIAILMILIILNILTLFIVFKISK